MNIKSIGLPARVDLDYKLEDHYLREDGTVFLSGTQALVRILIDQARSDQALGVKTAGLVSGYRGSPLGGVDQELWRQRSILSQFDVRFEPGLNEDLGATMLWGAQQIDAFPGKRVDGVFGMWYGKGPGVDRTGDVFRNANMLGTSRYGGVLAVAGDDHAAQSSMLPHQTDHVFEGSMMPIIFPASVDEYIDFGMFGYALSRFSGLWVGFKAITETVESGRTTLVRSPIAGVNRFRAPPDIIIPERGIGFDPKLIYPAQRVEGERRLVEERLPAAMAFARDNSIDRMVVRSSNARIGLVTVGKAHGDLIAALSKLGLGQPELERLGIAVYKIGLVWPLETHGLRDFAEGLQCVLVVEEKRSFVEAQIKDALFNTPGSRRPEVYGKLGIDGGPLLPATMEFGSELLIPALRKFLRHFEIDVTARQEESSEAATSARVIPLLQAQGSKQLTRQPFFCAGCPHNTSTKVPEGSFAAAGIGCHIMALGQVGGTATFCQMGGEGIQWVGLSSFTETPHMFVNLGDGTYQHSGSLAIRQAVAAKTNVTFKILFNDAVAMTGGQPTEGGLTVPRVVRQVLAEDVRNVVVVTDEPDKYQGAYALPADIEVRHRAELDTVQRELRVAQGVSVLVYDQTCAAEKRRRRKRGKLIDPPKRVVINPRVCEGCGDCSAQSNCIAIEPLETELGRKRTVNQSTCNKDMSCLKGFCPSFVLLDNAEPKRPDADAVKRLEARWKTRLPLPKPVDEALVDHTRIIVTGVGGTGVVTIGAILAMAAHLEGKAASTLDFTGVAQKNGAVLSHVQIADTRSQLGTSRIGAHAADVVIGCDAVVTASAVAVSRIKLNWTRAVVNNVIAPTAEFVRDGDLPISKDFHGAVIEDALGSSAGHFWDCTEAAQFLFGDSIATNMMMVGYAFQLGWLPVSEEAIMRAIELNGAAVSLNQRSFFWGRVAAHDVGALRSQFVPSASRSTQFQLESFVSEREADLKLYQNEAYANRYSNLVGIVERTERHISGETGPLTEAIARNYFKVLAYKDEYEVARLYTDGAFDASLSQSFDGAGAKTFYMAPPLISPLDPATGRRKKIALRGKWVIPLFKVLRHGKALRGTRLDFFGRQPDRVMERALILEYEEDVRLVTAQQLDKTHLDAAVALLQIPAKIRGFGVVKERNYATVQVEREHLRATLLGASPGAQGKSGPRKDSSLKLVAGARS
jgi:indolepyruvate ferredoxin oxidoreductase